MRLSHPTQVIMKPLYACNFGCGSTGSGRYFVGTALRGRGMFVGSILNRAAHLPWLDEVNEFTSSR